MTEEKTDLIEEMRCKNCKYLTEQYGNYCCKLKPNGVVLLNPDGTKKDNEYEAVSLDSECSYFDKAEVNAMRKMYEEIKNILRFYTDTKEENYDLIALWIMGTYVHKDFLTYPYLFFNAMKGSGKTRMLKLIKELSNEGDMLASLSDAVLFRTTGTLCIDEFENIRSKDKNSLRELLNTAYKVGGKVKRMKKKKTIEGEEQVVEEFSTFRPIAMANISGMEEVLGDRCISLILEKSSNKSITRKVENFDTNPFIQTLKLNLKRCRSVGWCMIADVYKDWNTYVSYTPTLYTLPTLPTPTYTKYTELFQKIDKTGVDGRNLELFLPLIILSQELGVQDRCIDIMEKITKSRNVDEIMESKDVRLLDFISAQSKDWFRIKELTNIFRNYLNEEGGEDPWLNSVWMGRALKRLGMIIDKRRLGDGVEVTLDTEKAKLKAQMFK